MIQYVQMRKVGRIKSLRRQVMNRMLRGFLNLICKFLRACTCFLSPVRFGSSNKMVRASITPQRLQQVANDAAAKEIHKASLMLKAQVDRNVLHCRFLGLTPPNAPLNAKAKGLSAAQLSLAWLLGQEQVSVVFVDVHVRA